jgi:hypothetical protein
MVFKKTCEILSEMQATEETGGNQPAIQLNFPPAQISQKISFVACLRLIRDFFHWAAITQTPGALPKRMVQMRVDLRRFILPPRRGHRAYPRHVKIKMSGYARNHGHPK